MGIFPKLFDAGIIDGQVALYPNYDAYSAHNAGSYLPYRTRDIPSGHVPKVIVYNDTLYGDTGQYDDDNFRIYEENFDIYKHRSISD